MNLRLQLAQKSCGDIVGMGRTVKGARFTVESWFGCAVGSGGRFQTEREERAGEDGRALI